MNAQMVAMRLVAAPLPTATRGAPERRLDQSAAENAGGDRIEAGIAAAERLSSPRPATPNRPAPVVAGPRRCAGGIALATTQAAAAAIRAGLHQIRTVDGRAIRFPSQNLAAIESRAPGRPGQSHTLTRHVGETLADDLSRLEHHPLLRAAGGYTDAGTAQLATDRTIANPANQSAIGAFLADPGRLRTALARVDVGAVVGTSAMRDTTGTVAPGLIPGRTATVVLIKDPTFPEGYRVLTSYPDTRGAEVDANGGRIA
jgi:hypothetical protein